MEGDFENVNLQAFEAEESINRTSRECEQEEAQRLGEFAIKIESPTLEVERNWNRIRWDVQD